MRELSQATNRPPAELMARHGRHGRRRCGPSPCECACSPTQQASLALPHTACAGVGRQAAAAGDIDEWIPHRGRRVGEAAHPGPPSARQRALNARAQTQSLAAARPRRATTKRTRMLPKFSRTPSATQPLCKLVRALPCRSCRQRGAHDRRVDRARQPRNSKWPPPALHHRHHRRRYLAAPCTVGRMLVPRISRQATATPGCLCHFYAASRGS